MGVVGSFGALNVAASPVLENARAVNEGLPALKFEKNIKNAVFMYIIAYEHVWSCEKHFSPTD